MKVTALIDKELIEEGMEISKSKNISELLREALKGYIRTQNLKRLTEMVAKEPLEFTATAEEIRENNRQR